MFPFVKDGNVLDNMLGRVGLGMTKLVVCT